MKICRVFPSSGTCDVCMNYADMDGSVPNCMACKQKQKTYELLQIGAGFFGSYAFVLADGKIEKVSLDRVFDIREEDRNQ